MSSAHSKLFLGALLGLAPSIALAAPGVDADGCPTGPPPLPEPTPHRWPKTDPMPSQTLLVDYDRCGRVTEVRVQNPSSDQLAFDNAAAAAARVLRFTPERLHGALEPGFVKVLVWGYTGNEYEISLTLPVPQRYMAVDPWGPPQVSIAIDANGTVRGFFEPPIMVEEPPAY